MPTIENINLADINKDSNIIENKLFTLYTTPKETIDNESTNAKMEMDIADAFQDLGIDKSYGMYKEKEADTFVTYDLRREIPEAKGEAFKINSNTNMLEAYDPDSDEFYITVNTTSFQTHPAQFPYEKVIRHKQTSEVNRIDVDLYAEITGKTEAEHQATQCQFLEYSLLKSLKAEYTVRKTIKDRANFTTTTTETTTGNKFTGTYLKIDPVLTAETFLKIKQTLRRAKSITKNKKTICAFFVIHEHFDELMKLLFAIPDVANHYIAQGISQQLVDTIKAGQSNQTNLQNKARLLAEKFGTMFDFGDGIKIYSVPDYLASELWNNTTNRFDMAYVMSDAYTTIDILTPKPILSQQWSQNINRATRPMPKLGYFVQEKLDGIQAGKYMDGLRYYSLSNFAIVPTSDFSKAGFISMDNSMIGDQTAINNLKANYDIAYNQLLAKFSL